MPAMRREAIELGTQRDEPGTVDQKDAMRGWDFGQRRMKGHVCHVRRLKSPIMRDMS